MLIYLAGLEEWFGPFRLFGYITFRALMAGITALVVGFVAAPRLLRVLRRLKMKQSVRTASEVGSRMAELHSAKGDTPTMGGLIIAVAFLVSAFLWAAPNAMVIAALWVFASLCALGFWDDYLKVSKKNSKGVSGRVKLLAQGVVTLVALLILASQPESAAKIRELWVPFYKYIVIDTMPWFAVFAFLYVVLAGSSNAINLTDGVDGLAIGCTVASAMAFAIMAYFAGNVIISDYLFISMVPGAGELAIVCSALLGASLVFLWYNAHPAQIFMGDTGSLALGGLIGAVAFMINQPFTLVIVGGVFVMEALSVILQVGSFKLRKVRIFRMSPIHHHFELGGWHENQVVIRFWILSLLCAIAGLGSLKLR
jgi:phospho-N-acetylmuramoyl-pentapeptide-transferase